MNYQREAGIAYQPAETPRELISSFIARMLRKCSPSKLSHLSHKNPVPFGKTQNLMAEFLIVCVLLESPVIYILKAKEAEEALHRGEKEGHISYWLQSYEDHKDSWNKIGTGFDLNNP
jgi:hypothetical protein